MATQQDVIDAIAVIQVAATALDVAIKNIRDANTVLDGGGAVGNAVVAAAGNSRGALEGLVDASLAGLPALVNAVDTAIAAADAVADALV